jgi:hypothetical protein
LSVLKALPDQIVTAAARFVKGTGRQGPLTTATIVLLRSSKVNALRRSSQVGSGHRLDEPTCRLQESPFEAGRSASSSRIGNRTPLRSGRSRRRASPAGTGPAIDAVVPPRFSSPRTNAAGGASTIAGTMMIKLRRASATPPIYGVQDSIACPCGHRIHLAAAAAICPCGRPESF